MLKLINLLNKIDPILQFAFILKPLGDVIPAQAGIHVFQDIKWTPAYAGVTVIRDICSFEIGSTI